MLLGARVISREMKREIGHYQRGDGEFEDWPKLASSTLRQKRRKGQSPPDNPLKATGAMRDAIGESVTDDGFEAVAGAKASASRDGTPAPVAAWQNDGTANGHVPARNFVGRAAYREGEKAVAEIAGAIMAGLFGVTRK